MLMFLHCIWCVLVESLHGVLVDLVTTPAGGEDQELGREVQSLACACLLSLVVAWGQTGPLLMALSSVLITSAQRGDIQLQVCFLVEGRVYVFGCATCLHCSCSVLLLALCTLL